jgi:N-acetyl-S-(2-succino)cysteine monooxygenase
MSTPKRQLHLNVFLMGAGHHEAAWRRPGFDPDRLRELSFYRDIARTAERGKFDSLFTADIPYLNDSIVFNGHTPLEPLTLLSALAASTERIGLIATASTSFTEPYNLARQFASLDQLSGGRAGWNIVTTSVPATAFNYGREPHAAHAERYARSREFVEVVEKLWDSWEADAIVLDHERGLYAEPDRIHRAEHVGERFDVKGALDIPRSPQGRPVLVQAGSSEAGRDFAARFAEAVFTSQFSVEEGREFFADVKARAAGFGRDPETLKILPGVIPILGGTEEEARRKQRELFELTRPEAGIAGLKTQLGGIDLSDHPLDAPFPDLGDVSNAKGGQQRFELIVGTARREKMTLRDVLQWLAGGHGHRVFAGTPEQLADEIETWLVTEACDGFNLMPPTFPESLDDFVDQVVPLLQARGIFREDYAGTTLRDHYDLPEPANAYTSPVEAAA